MFCGTCGRHGQGKGLQNHSQGHTPHLGGLWANFLGEKDDKAVVSVAVKASASAAVPRIDMSQVQGLPGQSAAEHDKWMGAWRKMDLSHVDGFPVWEEEVFGILQSSFTDLYSIFAYYAGDAAGLGGDWSAETLQQTELVDLVLDTGLATKTFPMTMIVALFEAENKRNGAGDSDLELGEFLQLVVVLASKRTKGVPVAEALGQMVSKHLSRSTRLAELRPLVGSLKKDVAIEAVLKVHDGALRAFFAEGLPPRVSFGVTASMAEQTFLQQLSGAGLMKGCIVPLPAEAMAERPVGAPAEVRCDLLWLDVSATFHACASSDAGLTVSDYEACLALCGMVKYAAIEQMTPVQRVAGFLANLAGRMDEADVVTTAFSRASTSAIVSAPSAAAEPAAAAQSRAVGSMPLPAPAAAPLAAVGAAAIDGGHDKAATTSNRPPKVPPTGGGSADGKGSARKGAPSPSKGSPSPARGRPSPAKATAPSMAPARPSPAKSTAPSMAPARPSPAKATAPSVAPAQPTGSAGKPPAGRGARPLSPRGPQRPQRPK